MNRDDAILATYERLVEALSAGILDATDDDVLAGRSTAAARVAADDLRRRLPPAASGDAAGPPPSDVLPAAPTSAPGRPEKKP